MINRLKYATIADIGIYDLVFYDELKVEENIRFAKENGITYLPAKNRKEVYLLNDGKFEKTQLNDVLKINPYDRVFDKDTLEKFKQVNHNEIRFIVENELIKGVVHIVDYNNEFLQVQLYRALFLFESNVRKILVANRKTNDDFIEWIAKQIELVENNEHWKKRYRELKPKNIDVRAEKEKLREELNPFQTFYLSDLLQYAADLNIVNLTSDEIRNIGKVRNQIAHSVDFTSSNTDTSGNLIFNFEELSKFVKNIGEFFIAYDDLLEKVENHNQMLD